MHSIDVKLEAQAKTWETKLKSDRSILRLQSTHRQVSCTKTRPDLQKAEKMLFTNTYGHLKH